MKRADLEHLIRAASVVSDDTEIIVLGSQAILGEFPDAPAELLVSDEADIFPKNFPDRWELIDGTLGELSPFHQTFGYYAQGVEEEVAILPAGWRDRLVPICNPNTRGATGLCLEVHDLLVAKAIAGREKDVVFINAATEHKMADRQTLRTRLAATTIDDARRQRAAHLLGLG